MCSKPSVKLFHLPSCESLTDSCVVLDWIQRKTKLKSFVTHRVNEITLHSDPLNWNYVPTKQNPVDHGTRGLKPEAISAEWIKGPSFLNKSVKNWPKRPQTTCTAIVIDEKSVLFDTQRFSTWSNLLNCRYWDFNPPSAPHFGGPWKRMIQTAKRTLLNILGSQKLTLEFFTTILAETELMLNSRPLTHVNDQPENEKPLTPNHFVLHRLFANVSHIVFEETDKPLSFNSWKEVQKVSNHFWKRFLKEYLPTLDRRQKRTKATPLKVDDIVWLLQDFTPRGIRPLGKITATHPGKDGVTGVCTVKTAYGTFERPVVSFPGFPPERFARTCPSIIVFHYKIVSPLSPSCSFGGGGGGCGACHK